MTQSILAIDDEMVNLVMLEEYLSDEDYDVTTMQNANDALDHLDAGNRVDAILLDRMMPGMNGMEFLERIKSDERFKSIPVIMQTAAAAQDQIAEGIQAGAYYYLTKPFKRNVLLSILRTALRDSGAFDNIRNRMEKIDCALKCLESCSFAFQTLDDVKNISTYFSAFYPQPEEAIVGLKELMINAVEHGNLSITYDDKTELNAKGTWEEEVKRRLGLPENRDKFARARIERKDGDLLFILEDEGPGFDWEPYLQIDPKRALHNHGRGIAMSNMLSFDEIEYVEPGNKVICRKKCA